MFTKRLEENQMIEIIEHFNVEKIIGVICEVKTGEYGEEKLSENEGHLE